VTEAGGWGTIRARRMFVDVNTVMGCAGTRRRVGTFSRHDKGLVSAERSTSKQ